MQETIDFIKSKIGNFAPEIGIVLGSGLGELADEYCDIAIPYSEIPGFLTSTIKGHKGRLVFANISGKNVVMMQGRFHFYEGYSMKDVTYPIKVLKKLGIKTLILTNAAGAINENYKPADLMLITDHINFMGTNPLIGKNDETLGERFPDMTEIYKKDLINLAQKSADKLNIKLQKGVYLASSGPSYETPAEIKMMRTMGADAVGMSTVPEAIIANYCNLDILGISCISNSASGVGNSTKLSHNEVINTANEAKDKFKKLVIETIKNIY